MSRNRPNNDENQSWREFIKQTDHYINWVDRLSNAAKSSWRWVNTPEGINPLYIEDKLLYEVGFFGAFDDPTYGLIAQRISETGQRNLFDQPTKYRVDNKFMHKKLDAGDVIICRNNINRTPTCVFVENYATKLAELEYSIDCNLEQQLFSHMLICDKNEMHTMRNIVAQVQTGRPVIYGDTRMKDRIEDIPLNSPFIADRLMDIYHSIYHDCLRFFGITASGEDKKERVQSAEVEASNGELNINIEMQLKYRREFCEEVNKRFGTDMYVEFVGGQKNEEDYSGINGTDPGAGQFAAGE